MMRLLFVNHLHPNTGLIGAVRLQRFGEELAARGHRVLLLCACHEGHPDTTRTFADRIATHDWASPFILSVADDSFSRRGNADQAWAPMRRARTAATLMVYGGTFWRWRRAARAFSEPIHRLFKPELAYATFVNLDALGTARDYAKRYDIPWVMDIKDPASGFIPTPLASWLMKRYRDASAVTLNSEYQRSHNKFWADDNSIVIYSGVEPPPPQTHDAHDPARVAMIGSIYSSESVEVLLRGFAVWRKEHRPDAVLHYFGVNSHEFKAAAGRVGCTEGLVVEDQIPRASLLTRCTAMSSLIYSAHPGHTFHHKLLELAALGRPIITNPPESDESQGLCSQFGIRLTGTTTATEVTVALMAASDTPSMSMTRLNEEMSWSSAAAKLENVFENAVGNPQALHMPADGDGTRPLNIAIATLGRYHVLDLARELDSLGHYVRFYSYVPKRRAIKFGLPEHCHVSLLPYLAPLLLFSRVCQRTRFAEFSQTVVHRAIDALVASRLMPCDIFIGMSGTFIKAPVTARKKFGAKVVVERGSTHIQTQQEILASVKLLNPHTKSIAPVNVVRELESYAIADKIAVPSLHAEQSFINHGFPANVMIRNPYGVDLTMFSPDSSVPRDSRLVLFVGGWCYRKGADILSAAMDTLSTQGFHLCHVGDVIDAPVPNASWFRSVGPVDQSELSIWYQRAGCLVQPSRQEGLSLVLIQALACGCPVVATTMTGASDLAAILPNSGMVHVVPVGDVDGLARAIAEGPVSCTDKASLEQLRSKLSWRAYAQRYVVELYRLIRQA